MNNLAAAMLGGIAYIALCLAMLWIIARVVTLINNYRRKNGDGSTAKREEAKK